MQLRTSERIIRAEWSQVIECAPGRRAGRTRRGYFKKATPCRGAASRRRTRCHARGFARARTHGRAIASPRLALSPTGAPPNPGDNFGFFGPMRAGSRSMLSPLPLNALYMLARSTCSQHAQKKNLHQALTPILWSRRATDPHTIWSDDRVLCFHGWSFLSQFLLPARS